MNVVEHCLLVLTGLLIVWIGRWMFFHPERVLKKIYGDLMPATPGRNILLRLWASLWVAIGFWTCIANLIPKTFWTGHFIETQIPVGALVLTCIFLALRRGHHPVRD